MCSIVGTAMFQPLPMRSDAISPQAADVVDSVINNVDKSPQSASQEDGSDYQRPSPSVDQSQGQSSSEHGSPAQQNHITDSGPSSEGDRSSERFLYDDSLTDQAKKSEREDSLLAERYGQPTNPFTSAFSAEEARLRFSLNSSDFKEKYSHLNSSLDEEELRQPYLFPGTPTSLKNNYLGVLGSPHSPSSKSLNTSPNQSFHTSGSQQSPEDSDSAPAPSVRGGVYFCHLCSFSGSSQKDFDDHMTCHFEHTCPHCDYKSRTEGRLKRHIKDFHTEDPEGGFGARTMPGRPKVFRCKQCDFSATNKVEFWSHSRTHIKEDKLLQCPRCPFVTEYKHHLEYHLRNHFGSKPFKCPKCNYACVNKSMLNSHMKSHTNVYQYRCADCTYATKYCHSLKLHLRKYNHKPAAVLNSDGSLPQGLDATASGLSLLAKRGPPRGPRGPRKDKSEPVMGSFMSMPPSPMARMPGMPGMMSPYWPLLQNQMPNGLPHPLRHFPPQMMPLPGTPVNGDLSPASTKSFKCNLCSFTAPAKEILMSHMVKVHASENQDLFSIFGISSEALLEENHKRFSLMKSPGRKFHPYIPDQIMGNGHLKIKTEVDVEKSKTSPHSWPEHISPRTPNDSHNNQNTSEMSFPMNGLNASRDGTKDEGVDILKQMTLKFGAGLARNPDVKAAAPPMKRTRVESPLDLTKPRETTPPYYTQPFTALQANHTDDGEHSSGENSTYSIDIASPSPRKRSRKGRAFKLDTLCLKLQERRSAGTGSYHSDDDSIGDMGECDYNQQMRSLENMTCSPEGLKDDEGTPCKDQEKTDGESRDNASEVESHDSQNDDEEENKSETMPERMENDVTPDYNQIHSSLKILNSEVPNENISIVTENGRSSNSENKDVPVSQMLPASQIDNESDKSGKVPNNENLNAKFNRRKPMQPSMLRGNDIAWKILNNPFITDPQHYKNGEQDKFLDPRLWMGAPEFTSTPKKQSMIDPNYECHHCQIAFGDCIMYTMHMGYHGYKDPYKCNMCGSSCKDRVEFFLHIARAAHN